MRGWVLSGKEWRGRSCGGGGKWWDRVEMGMLEDEFWNRERMKRENEEDVI